MNARVLDLPFFVACTLHFRLTLFPLGWPYIAEKWDKAGHSGADADAHSVHAFFSTVIQK